MTSTASLSSEYLWFCSGRQSGPEDGRAPQPDWHFGRRKVIYTPSTGEWRPALILEFIPDRPSMRMARMQSHRHRR
ncbi:unnamed protein product [Protopolystoma xenopodis]|uniref:Uncharacterized protein n=1 Tax=Protopolystoma xenopodis TaxID=117903 RepID=A0A3S5B647_9PLAT|nr:unnamed protein product [Protopolystoma xenopodis]